MPPKIVVVGAFNADLVAYAPRLPKRGETVNGHGFQTGPGGKGSNQAVATARLGAQVAFVGRVGDDEFASIGFRLWEAEGIDARCVVRDPERTTGVATIFVEDSGENCIVVVVGANRALSPADVDAAADVIAGADVLLTQFEIGHESIAHALKLAKENGVCTSMPRRAEVDRLVTGG